MKMYQISKNKLVEGEILITTNTIKGIHQKITFQTKYLKTGKEEISFSDLVSLETAYDIITNLDIQQEVLNYKR